MITIDTAEYTGLLLFSDMGKPGVGSASALCLTLGDILLLWVLTYYAGGADFTFKAGGGSRNGRTEKFNYKSKSIYKVKLKIR